MTPVSPGKDYVLGPRTWQKVVTVSAPNPRALQDAIKRAGPSSIVVVPAGRYEIDDPLILNADDVLLVGAGAGSLGFDSPPDAGSTVFARTQDEGGKHLRPMVRVVGAHRVELSGIRFEGVTGEFSSSKDIGIQIEDTEDFRVDHCYFARMGFAGVRTNGKARGVIDHSTFFAEWKSAINTDGYGVAVYGTNTLAGVPLGQQDPAAPPNATVVEDCRFAKCRHAIASNKGGRYVFRRNYVTNNVIAHAVDVHGAEYGSAVGGEWLDVYENVIEQTSHATPFYDGWAIRVRGGKGAIWDNTIRGYKIGVMLTEQTDQPCGPVYVWGNTLDPAGGQLVTARRSGGSPEWSPEAMPAYKPHAYPHPLAAPCAGKPTTNVGGAQVCPAG